MESALQASLGVASQAAKPLGRGVRGGRGPAPGLGGHVDSRAGWLICTFDFLNFTYLYLLFTF